MAKQYDLFKSRSEVLKFRFNFIQQNFDNVLTLLITQQASDDHLIAHPFRSVNISTDFFTSR